MKIVTVITKFNMNVNERFWIKVDKKKEDECWNWTASKNQEGYGQFKIDDKMVKSHRFVYELLNGKIEDDLFVLHTCDNPACCNPKHLYLGTQQDNMSDMVNKKRSNKLKGEQHGRSLLNWEQVNEIRELYLTRKYDQNQLSLKYDMSQSNISDILNNKTWKDENYIPIHITGKEGELSWSSKLTWSKVNIIREKYYKYGIRTCQLCKEFDVSDGAIYKILHNLSWFDINFKPLLIIEKRDNEIREKYYKSNISLINLAKEFNIRISVIKNILTDSKKES